jgi:heparosan-N-sulfate-glucuronate 5-epimerase
VDREVVVTPVARRSLARTTQDLARFVPGDPGAGYYNDLTLVARGHGDVAGSTAALANLTRDRVAANPVSIAQLGLGAWQLGRSDPAWNDVALRAAIWLRDALEDDGLIEYRTSMPHTYDLQAPWASAMAQGEAASLFVRVSLLDGDSNWLAAARRSLDPLSPDGGALVAPTEDGPVLQEYPTTPPAHVLNGWIFGLFGVYDVAISQHGDPLARAWFEQGVTTLSRRLRLYETTGGWSRYDLFPHRISHVASPFYHRLHVSLLRAVALIRPDVAELRETADRWEKADRFPVATLAVARKVAFRLAVPRR